MATPKGFVLQRSKSPIDGAPIVVVMTLQSANRKTGNMAQVWILREDESPVEAVKSGLDRSICGDCIHRYRQLPNGKWVRSCYVNVGQAPLSVWRAYKAGNYKMLWTNEALEAAVTGRAIRWGAYGDPAMVEPKMVRWLNRYAASHTGYTHQWRKDFAQAFRGTFMASCDGFVDYLDATAQGWKTFSVIPKAGAQTANPAKQCPATVDGSSATCLTCKLCDGAKADIFVTAHGAGAKYV